MSSGYYKIDLYVGFYYERSKKKATNRGKVKMRHFVSSADINSPFEYIIIFNLAI